jgi:outer membrane protein TolC
VTKKILYQQKKQSKVQTKLFLNITAALGFMFLTAQAQLPTQTVKVLKLEDAIDLALQNNHLLNVRKYQTEEKLAKVNEDRVKFLPVIGIGGSYQYNTNLPSITVEQGMFGTLPFSGVYFPLPPVDEIIEVGKHNVYNAGVTFYQTVSQIGKINAGVQFFKAELQIALTEESKATFQIKQAVEKLYFGLLILTKQIEEADIKVELAKTKLHDVESAIAAGKTTESSIYGLSANAADEEQNLLKLKIQYDDYSADLMQLIGLDPAIALELQPISADDFRADLATIDTSIIESSTKNNDLKMASLNKTKADYSIKASKFSYLPDLGILGGYTYQEGTEIYPRNNAYIGASLKWNLQDVLSNRTVQKQRTLVKKQAEENLANTKEQVSKDIAKAYRKLKQAEELINVAGKVVDYRKADLKIQSDKRTSGLNLEADLLSARASMAKAESDYYAAQMNYRIALSELKILTGNY